MLSALKKHWPEYLMEAAGLGIFMVSASVFTILLYHPASPALQVLHEEFPRRVFMGLSMGLTAVGIIYSPWGKRSGAHLNPAVTLTFFRLGKVAPWDAAFYVIAQFAGGVAGVAHWLLRRRENCSPIRPSTTLPRCPVRADQARRFSARSSSRSS